VTAPVDDQLSFQDDVGRFNFFGHALTLVPWCQTVNQLNVQDEKDHLN
jgi:hypothetical protein